MEVLNDNIIQAWLDVGNGNGNGYGNGGGYGSGYGDGNGNGNGSGNGNGGGSGNGNGNGSGNGYGYGNGNGYGNGSGYGYGYGYGIKEFEGHILYNIDGVPTGIVSIKKNVAKGFVLNNNVVKKDCFVVKENGVFAHGDTLRDAFLSLQEKLYDDSTEEERIKAFKAKFPYYDEEYNNEDLFAYHHVLTGSCRMGREAFCVSRGIDMDGKTSVREFVELTKNDYGGEIIKKLPNAYGVKRN